MIARWTIGPVRQTGFHSLRISVETFQNLYPNANLYVCHNGLERCQIDLLKDLPVKLINQDYTEYAGEKPIGVAWKLCPPRISLASHELFIDNDLVIREPLNEINEWVDTDSTLMLEGEGRHYGRFERHIPSKYNINSGLFGVPPGFDLGSYIALWGKWSSNCPNESRTWDEQGLVASALTHFSRHVIVPKTTVVNCENTLVMASGLHFIGLNRRIHHRPFAEYVSNTIPFLL